MREETFRELINEILAEPVVSDYLNLPLSACCDIEDVDQFRAAMKRHLCALLILAGAPRVTEEFAEKVAGRLNESLCALHNGVTEMESTIGGIVREKEASNGGTGDGSPESN